MNPIHPRLKGPVADRLARLLRAQLYGETGLVAHGPQLEAAEGTASLAATTGVVTVVLKLDASKPRNSGLSIRPTPGCLSCCSASVAGLLMVEMVGAADAASSYTPVVTVDSRSATLSFSFSLASSSPARPLQAVVGSRLTVLVEQSSWPGCVLYNADGLPALPASISLTLATGLPNISASGAAGAAHSSSALWATVVITASALTAVALCVAVCAQSLSVPWREELPSRLSSDVQQVVKRLNFDSEEAQLIGTDSEDESSSAQAIPQSSV